MRIISTGKLTVTAVLAVAILLATLALSLRR